ncbi:MAG: hypothetical protein M1837_005249 [Sclerophora amabilis]|nr:MAG: hypothetical protein M1837_005249 [Sclerophora amabilis]
MAPSAATNTKPAQSAVIQNGHARPAHAEHPDISLFLRNLRLLDLDQRPDWPSITAVTFSTKDAQHNQRNRIRCVEWALFRLFELWDPEETRNKLQPFFPPLEPLQSLNLRAALFRCLSELKKTRVLGRDTVLRKSMLDECKGERFEELLLVFSSAVLKKGLITKYGTPQHDSVVERFCSTECLSNHDRDTVHALVLAHGSSLTRKLRQREDARARYQDISDLLELKQRQIARREEEIKARKLDGAESCIVPVEDVEALEQQFRDHWLGNPKILDLILRGDSDHDGDQLLREPFDDVWHHVESHRVTDLDESPDKSLIAQLEGTLKRQTDRLAKWKRLRHDLLKDQRPIETKTASSQQQSTSKTIDLRFEEHKTLMIDPIGIPRKAQDENWENATLESTADPASAHEYERLLESMRAEIANVGKSKTRRGRGWRSLNSRSHPPVETSGSRTSSSDHSRYEGESHRESVPEGKLPQHISTSRNRDVKAVESEETQSESEGTYSKATSPIENQSKQLIPPNIAQASAQDVSVLSEAHLEPLRESEAAVVDDSKVSVGKCSPIDQDSVKRAKPSRLSLLDLNDQELLADQMISAAIAPSPSPSKPHPSLVERTRMSMAFSNPVSSALPISEEAEEEDTSPSPTDRKNHSPTKSSHAPTDENLQTSSLTKRTRESLSTFTKLSPTTTKKSQRRPSQFPSKKAAYPPNPFSTPPPPPSRHNLRQLDPSQRPPGESSPDEEQDATGTVTPRDELFAQEADYASVFKSRPKIALSPPSVSPVRASPGDLPEFDDLDDVDEEGDDERLAEEEWANSPLGKIRRG